MQTIDEFELNVLQGFVLGKNGKWCSIDDALRVDVEYNSHLDKGEILYKGKWVPLHEIPKDIDLGLEKEEKQSNDTYGKPASLKKKKSNSGIQQPQTVSVVEDVPGLINNQKEPAPDLTKEKTSNSANDQQTKSFPKATKKKGKLSHRKLKTLFSRKMKRKKIPENKTSIAEQINSELEKNDQVESKPVEPRPVEPRPVEPRPVEPSKSKKPEVQSPWIRVNNKKFSIMPMGLGNDENTQSHEGDVDKAFNREDLDSEDTMTQIFKIEHDDMADAMTQILEIVPSELEKTMTKINKIGEMGKKQKETQSISNRSNSSKVEKTTSSNEDNLDDWERVRSNFYLKFIIFLCMIFLGVICSYILYYYVL